MHIKSGTRIRIMFIVILVVKPRPGNWAIHTGDTVNDECPVLLNNVLFNVTGTMAVKSTTSGEKMRFHFESTRADSAMPAAQSNTNCAMLDKKLKKFRLDQRALIPVLIIAGRRPPIYPQHAEHRITAPSVSTRRAVDRAVSLPYTTLRAENLRKNTAEKTATTNAGINMLSRTV